MRTTKTIPTLMRAVSLGAAMMLVSEAAVARNDRHQEHSDHQGRSEIKSGSNGSEARSGKPSGQAGNRAGAVTWGGSPPRSPASSAGKAQHRNDGNAKNPAAPKGDATANAKPGPGAAPAKTPVATTAPAPTTMPGGSAPASPVATANPTPAAGPPPGASVVSNGQVKLYIPNSPAGLSVTSDKPGTITVSNGDPAHSVTLPGGSVTISGGTALNTVAGGPGVQVVSHPNGDFVAAANSPPPIVTVTGGPEGGFVNALGNGLVDTGKGILNTLNPVQGFTGKASGPPPPPPQTSTSVQR